MSVEPVPEHAYGVVNQLIEESYLREEPRLTAEQWEAIERYATPFSEQGPNPKARKTRRKLAYYQMVLDALRQ